MEEGSIKISISLWILKITASAAFLLGLMDSMLNIFRENKIAQFFGIYDWSWLPWFVALLCGSILAMFYRADIWKWLCRKKIKQQEAEERRRKELKRNAAKNYNMSVKKALIHIKDHYESLGVKPTSRSKFLDIFVDQIKEGHISVRGIAEQTGSLEYVDSDIFADGAVLKPNKGEHKDIVILCSQGDLLYSALAVDPDDVDNVWPMEKGWMAS